MKLYLVRPAEPMASNTQPLLCAYPDDLDFSPESRFLEEIGVKVSARCLTKNLLVMRKLIDSGKGMAVLPSFMCVDLLADASYAVSPLPTTRQVWLLLQPHLKNDDDARRVIDWIKGQFLAAARALNGRSQPYRLILSPFRRDRSNKMVRSMRETRQTVTFASVTRGRSRSAPAPCPDFFVSA